MVKHKGAAKFQEAGELQFVETLRRRVGRPRTVGVILGIGDDCAIVRPKGSAEDLLYTTDMFIEGVHFLRETHRAADAGWKALARGLSDIAAMGGEPRFCLLSLALHRLCTASGLSAAIETPPVFAGASVDQALHGGEDYELLFTVPPRARLPRAFDGLPLTRIGIMHRGRPGLVEWNGAPLEPK